nr:DUF6233 domain-containing protein [Streptomyces coryli]
MHRDDCPVTSPAGESGGFTAAAARDALIDTHTPVTPCEICRPETELIDELRPAGATAPGVFLLQKHRKHDGRPQRYTLHTVTCVVTDGERLTAERASAALHRPEVAECSGCSPARQLQRQDRTATGTER